MRSIMKEMVGGCCVCSDERGWPENPLVYCDGQGCTVAVHQACYGIVTVPTGPWYCRKCESQERSTRVKCELCPSKDGALKRTDNSGWAHVVCALYIPEVRFGNVTTMEPIILQLIPTERFNKVCYICQELEKGARSTVGACMQCNKSGCKQQFHVTCAQALGLLCEEAGNYLDNVKYCGYCQHHYSKLKGGNVKTIPPYKPIPTDNHSSDSSPEKEADAANTANNPSTAPVTKVTQPSTSTSSSSSSKRKSSSSNNKSSSSKSSSSSQSTTSKSSSSTHQKTVHHPSNTSNTKNNTSAPDKSKNNLAQVKSKTIDNSSNSSEVVPETELKKEHHHTTKYFPGESSVVTDNNSSAVFESSSSVVVNSVKEPKTSSKKRKAGSRTPTPNSIVHDTDKNSVSTIVSAPSSSSSTINTQITTTVPTPISDVELEKTKKPKVELQAPVISQSQTIHLQPPTTIQSRTTSSPSVITTDLPASGPPSRTSTPHQVLTPAPPITTTSSATVVQPNSLVVSVPLVNTSLSPKTNTIIKDIPNPVVNLSTLPLYSHLPERTDSRSRLPPPTPNGANEHTIGISTSLDSTMVSSEGGEGLKISYEKQPTSHSSSLSRLQASDNATTPVVQEDTPAKRSRSQSVDKSEKMGRPKKRGSNGVPISGPATGVGKRTSRSQHQTPPPPPVPIQLPGAFSSVSQIVKESPPSSPSDENSVGSTRRTKGRKSAPATVTSASSSSSTASAKSDTTTTTKDSKDIKIYQNGVHAPHMLGNQLNPTSNMAQKMTDHLNSELEAHSIFNVSDNVGNNLIGPQLYQRVMPPIRMNSTPPANQNSNSAFSSMLSGGPSGVPPQTLDQLLERQWEQGSQFLMEQAQHFDIASLLSCLHQLRAENLRLEEHVNSLLQRRDHLLAVNARLAIPLTNQQPVAAPSQPHTLNNLHPSVSASHGDVPRTRHSSSANYPGGGGAPPPMENGLPPDGAAYPHQHRSPASAQPQPSPTIRHSPAGSYPGTSHGVVRSGSASDGSNRSSSQRSQSHSNYSQYPGQGQIPVVTSQQQQQQQQPQIVIRRDTDHHTMPSTKPS